MTTALGFRAEQISTWFINIVIYQHMKIFCSLSYPKQMQKNSSSKLDHPLSIACGPRRLSFRINHLQSIYFMIGTVKHCSGKQKQQSVVHKIIFDDQGRACVLCRTCKSNTVWARNPRCPWCVTVRFIACRSVFYP